MDFESLSEYSDSRWLNGTKRPPALPEVGCEAKRLCTQSSRLPSGSLDLELQNGHSSWGELSFAPISESGGAAFQSRSDSSTNWSSAVSPGLLVELDSSVNGPVTGTDPFSFDFMPAEMDSMNMQSSPGVNTIYPQTNVQGSTDSFNLDDFFYPVKTSHPSFQLDLDPNVSYDSCLLNNRTLPEPCFSPIVKPFTEGASTWIDMNTDPENSIWYQQPLPFVSHGNETFEKTPKAEGMIITSPKEAKSIGDLDTSENFSIIMENEKEISGKEMNANLFVPGSKIQTL